MAQNSNKPSKSLKDASPPPLPFAHHLKEAKADKKEIRGSASEVTQMLQRMKDMHDKIENLIQEALAKTGWTPQYLKAFLNNPNNFDGKEWEKIQTQRKELMKTIKTPRELQKDEEDAKKAPVNRQNAPHDPKIAKERRGKTVGARRNWLPMR